MPNTIIPAASNFLTDVNNWSDIAFKGPKVMPVAGRASTKFLHCQNETPSLENLVFGDPTQSPDCADVLKRKTKKTGGVQIQTTPAELQRLSNPVELMKDYEECIAEMAQRRVAAFFQQLVLSYKTKLHFEVGDTVDQAESATLRKLKSGGSVLEIKMDASHSNTIPCLYAYNLHEWDDYQQSLQNPPARHLPKPQGFIYLKGSDGYRFWNSTLEMPKVFNTSVDNTIDLGEKGLRKAGLNILNQAGRGEISPEEGLKMFVQQFLNITHIEDLAAQKKMANACRLNNQAEQMKNEAKSQGLKFYHAELLEIQQALEYNPEAFPQYLNIVVNPNDVSTDIERVIFEIRYQAIQQNFSHQSQIATEIENVKQRIFSQYKRLPAYAEEAFRELLIENSLYSDQKRIKKYFNTPYELRENATRRNGIDEAKAKLSVIRLAPTNPGVLRVNESGLQAIQLLSTKLSQRMHTMRTNEQSARGPIIRKLRQMRKWTQKDLSGIIQRYFPDLPSSQSTISRLETGVQLVDSDYAKKLSLSFRVDSALFMPQFFNE